MDLVYTVNGDEYYEADTPHGTLRVHIAPDCDERPELCGPGREWNLDDRKRGDGFPVYGRGYRPDYIDVSELEYDCERAGGVADYNSHALVCIPLRAILREWCGGDGHGAPNSESNVKARLSIMEAKKRARAYLKAYLKSLAEWADGECYWYEIDGPGEFGEEECKPWNRGFGPEWIPEANHPDPIDDSCGGFIGADYLRENIREAIDSWCAEQDARIKREGETMASLASAE